MKLLLRLLGVLLVISLFYYTVTFFLTIPVSIAPFVAEEVAESPAPVIAFTPTPEPTPEPTPTPIPEEIYDGTIYHIFFHALIAFPEISYKSGNSPLDEDCITPTEFKRVLEQLYENGYALIDINETYKVLADGSVKTKAVSVPVGKKPLIISVDDMVYDSKKMGTGMVDKLILDENGKVATYTKHSDGSEVISYDNEIVPILEAFIEEHPDFSIRGARGIFAMTGFAGVFGYRTDRLSDNQVTEIEAVMPIVEAVKSSGWTFASHGYGHRHSAKISDSLFLDDTQKWRKEVENIVGSTQIYVYPYGEYVTAHGTKYQIMQEYGFKVMCGVDSTQKWEEQGDGLFMTRLAIDGYSLRNYHTTLSPLIDTEYVLDREWR